MFNVVIKSYKDDKVVKKIECKSKREADRVDDGMNMNLDHENYYTVINEY